MTITKTILLILVLLPTLVSGDTSSREEVLWLPSRGIEIPATLTLPAAITSQYPLVVMAHGHGGSRDEAGGFSRLATLLANEGIASIRVDFSGCGDSRESLADNTIDNMLADLRAAREAALSRPGMDVARVGLLGYSMGGRLAMLSVADDFTYAALALWAPAASDGAADFFAFLGGADSYATYREQAAQSGSATITTPWGQAQELSLDWFSGLENSKPLQAVAGFTQPVLVLHGAADEVIPAANSEIISRVLPQTQRQVLQQGGHGLGFYDDEADVAKRVLQETAGFLVSYLTVR